MKDYFTTEAVVKIEVKMSDTNYAIGAFDIGFDKTAKPASGTGGISGGLKSNWNDYVNNSSESVTLRIIKKLNVLYLLRLKIGILVMEPKLHIKYSEHYQLVLF